MSGSSDKSRFPLSRYAAMLIGIGAGGAFAAGVITTGLGFADQWMPIALTSICCILAAVASLVPIWWLAGGSDAGIVQGFLLGTLMRLVMTGGAVVALDLATELPLVSIGAWAATWYLLLLGVEATLLAGFAKKVVAT